MLLDIRQYKKRRNLASNAESSVGQNFGIHQEKFINLKLSTVIETNQGLLLLVKNSFKITYTLVVNILMMKQVKFVNTID
jgi:hypothetical protein